MSTTRIACDPRRVLPRISSASRQGSLVSTTSLLAAAAIALAAASAPAQILLDAQTPESGSQLDVSPLVTTFGTILFIGEISSGTDAEVTAAGGGGNCFDGVGSSPATAQLDFDFDVFSVTFLYGGNGGGILVEAVDGGGSVVATFQQASTAAGQPAGPVTMAAARIRSLRWSDSSGGFVMLDNLEVRPMPVLRLDMETPATGSNLGVEPLVTPLGKITLGAGELSGSVDPDLLAAGGGGGSLDVAGILSLGRLDFTFEAECITFLYGGNGGDISVQALDAGGGVVDSFYQAATGAGQPAGPVSLSGGGIRFLQWQDSGGSFAQLDNIEIRVRPTVFLDADTPATGSELATSGMRTLYGAVTLREGKISASLDPEALAAGSSGNAFDLVGPPTAAQARLDFGFEADSVTFTYGGDFGSLQVTALDHRGAAVDTFYQASTDVGQPAGPHTLVGPGIRTLVWLDELGVYATIDELQIHVSHSVVLDADTPLTGSELATSTLPTPYGDISMPQVELAQASLDPEMEAAGAEGSSFDGVGSFPAEGRMELAFEASAISFLYGGGGGEINVLAFNGIGVLVDSFYQASTVAGPAGPVTLSAPGIRALSWSDSTGAYVVIDSLRIEVDDPPAPLCGDCDQNGFGPNVLDSLEAAQLAAGLLIALPGQLCACDVDASGGVTVLDALRLAQAAAGLPVVLSCI